MKQVARKSWGLIVAAALLLALWAAERLTATQPPREETTRNRAPQDASSRASASPAPSSSSTTTQAEAPQELPRLWNEAQQQLKRGAYRDALQTLDGIRTLAPDDPWVSLYRSLCEKRLSSSSLPDVPPSQLRTLEEQLKQEMLDQRRQAAMQNDIERQIRRDQEQWERNLAHLQQAADKEERVQQRRQQAEELKRRKAQRLSPPTPPAPTAQSPAPAVPKTSPSETPPAVLALESATKTTPTPGSTQPAPSTLSPAKEPTTPAASTSASTDARSNRSVELSPVVVSATPTTAQAPPPSGTTLQQPVAVEEPTVKHLPPPGAVAINARQMHVSPERKIATAEGEVEVLFRDAVLTCDRVTLFTDTKDLYAEGNVRLEEGEKIFRGEFMHYNVETKKARILQGSLQSPPWVEHGRWIEALAEGVYRVSPGYVTSCEQDPPHFKFYGRNATVFTNEGITRGVDGAFMLKETPLLYLPWFSFSNRQSPFFIVPGKKKPWEEFVLMGYRYRWADGQRGTIHLDWRRAFLWATGLDHQFDDKQWGKGLFKIYFNYKKNIRRPNSDLPKGGHFRRYRLLWRHAWRPLPDTTVITNIQKFSDVDFRRELLFREEFTNDDTPESFISSVTSTPNYTLSAQVRRRLNRFQSVTEALPQITLDVPQRTIGDTALFSGTSFDIADLRTKPAQTKMQPDVFRMNWVQQFRYALKLLRPFEITPNTSIHQTFYSSNKGPIDDPAQPEKMNNFFVGQFGAGADASLKLFRIFPVITNAFGLDINWLRHILTPTVSYKYLHKPTIRPEVVKFSTSGVSSNSLTFELENKLQTKRAVEKGKARSVDIARFLISAPYTFRGMNNKQGGRLGDFRFDLELYPYSWLRVETGLPYPSHVPNGQPPITSWNFDLVAVGGPNTSKDGPPNAKDAPKITPPAPAETIATSYDTMNSSSRFPVPTTLTPGPHGGLTLTPTGQWYLGYGHRYSHNDKTEDVLQFDIGLSPKWQVSTFHRFTWKEVRSGSKRFNNLREYQYVLRRDLHDWLAELVYRVDREFGEEIFLTVTLKAYPDMPIATGDTYHQPKFGSQSSPFSPLRTQS